ncbi:MAG: 50S ribosomal protein L9 [Proteobacteria bacterium]|nr:50S ribosomal protein L9 [Pseudomonadota bacterium]
MEVILLERVEKLGQMGDVVSVKPGFARNFLLPRNKALRATKGNKELFEQQRQQLETDNLTRKGEAEKVGEKLDGMRISMIRSAGESGQLYGSVTSRDIAEGVTAGGVTITRNQVVMGHPIKMLGLHEMRVSLHPEVSVAVVVNVARSEEEAERQAKLGRAITAQEEDRAEQAAMAAEAAAAAAAAAKSEEMLEQAPEEGLVESVVAEVTGEAEEAAAAESAAPAEEEAPAEEPAEAPGEEEDKA